ncbi:MAG: hypothetical protein M3Q68_10590 [Actinomycetota bacterium]|nr:hypothetical protein [Actinomycetota bacterium]
MKIRAQSVFEGIVYHCVVVDTTNPCRPTLEVKARTQAGDLDVGPLLVTVGDWARMVGDQATVKACLPELKRRRRLEERMGVLHVRFPTWTDVTGD